MLFSSVVSQIYVVDIMNPRWEPKPKYLSAIMVEHMRHVDHALMEQQQSNCKFNWNHVIGPFLLHIDHISKQDHGYDTRMLEMSAACIRMMQNHHKALLVGPGLYEFTQHLAKLEPPQEYDFLHPHQSVHGLP